MFGLIFCQGGYIYLVDGAFTIPHVWLDQDQNTAEGQILYSLIIDGTQSMNFFQFGVAVGFTGYKARTQLSGERHRTSTSN